MAQQTLVSIAQGAEYRLTVQAFMSSEDVSNTKNKVMMAFVHSGDVLFGRLGGKMSEETVSLPTPRLTMTQNCTARHPGHRDSRPRPPRQ